jgi:signal peptidase
LFWIIRIVNAALVSLAVAALLFFGWLFACNVIGLPTPRLGPLSVYAVLSDSMFPAISAGDAVFVWDVAAGRLEAGDVITFYADRSKNVVVTHRVIDVADDAAGRYFVTQGDNNGAPDVELAFEDSLIGKYLFRAPRFGAYMDVVGKTPYLAVFPVVAVILFQLCFGWAEELVRPRLSGGGAANGDVGPARYLGGEPPKSVGDGE